MSSPTSRIGLPRDSPWTRDDCLAPPQPSAATAGRAPWRSVTGKGARSLNGVRPKIGRSRPRSARIRSTIGATGTVCPDSGPNTFGTGFRPKFGKGLRLGAQFSDLPDRSAIQLFHGLPHRCAQPSRVLLPPSAVFRRPPRRRCGRVYLAAPRNKRRLKQIRASLTGSACGTCAPTLAPVLLFCRFSDPWRQLQSRGKARLAAAWYE